MRRCGIARQVRSAAQALTGVCGASIKYEEYNSNDERKRHSTRRRGEGKRRRRVTRQVRQGIQHAAIHGRAAPDSTGAAPRVCRLRLLGDAHRLPPGAGAAERLFGHFDFYRLHTVSGEAEPHPHGKPRRLVRHRAGRGGRRVLFLLCPRLSDDCKPRRAPPPP